MRLKSLSICLMVVGYASVGRAETRPKFVGISNDVEVICRMNSSNLSAEQNESRAQAKYEEVRAALFDMNGWAGKMFSGHGFRLYSQSGSPLYRDARVGDYAEVTIALDLTLRKYWDQVEEVEERRNIAGALNHHRAWVKIRASLNPTLRPLQPKVIQHFFDSSATNVYSVERFGSKIIFHIHGEGEKANTEHAANWFDASENMLISQLAWGYRKDSRALVGGQNISYRHFATRMLDCPK